MDLNIDFNNLDPNNIGSWPVAARIIVIILLCAALLFAGYYFDTSDQLLTLEQAATKEKSLKQEFEKKEAKAINLDTYKAQMQEMERSFGALLQQLPGKTEVAELLVDISRIGIQSGLEFELFKPQPEIPKEFYAELPIQIRVTGKYHQFGNFASQTAALSRIVVTTSWSCPQPRRPIATWKKSRIKPAANPRNAGREDNDVPQQNTLARPDRVQGTPGIPLRLAGLTDSGPVAGHHGARRLRRDRSR
jgi:type IV pilus assembly protein PilO